MLGQFLNQIGEYKTVYTMVDFYQYIKGFEYLICLALFISFPMFYKYINRTPKEDQE
ncbi:MAG TPA: hypothetical protein VJ910_09035 [Desulfuromonadales bacterium]|nr:hypothetical protein [Desulfuromonadales bacterium]